MESNVNWPRIVSLSTVGILKHYHQDYLIHPIRTDFVGSNGVGKSIIADLFQLLFITDRSLIEFGTEGLDDELRKIETIPYNTTEAFIFINIEVNEDNFITIGTCIPNRSTPLKQFIILRDYDLNKRIEDVTYNKSLFLTYNDFLNTDGTILSNQELSKTLRNNKNLYIKYFTYKEEKQEFYNWLFSKEILPINLAIEENLKAYAKVIQSFSKAKTLKIKKSNSLKEFLFDDAEKVNKKKFYQLKDELNKLLIEYHTLSNDIQDIETKQSELEKLKKFEREKNDAYLNFSKAEIAFLYQKLNKQKKERQKVNNQLEKVKEETKSINFRLEELTPLMFKTNYNYQLSDKNLYNLLQFQSHLNELKIFERELSEIEVNKIPEEEAKIKKNQELIESNKQEVESYSLEAAEKEIEKYQKLKSESDKVIELINKSASYYAKYISSSYLVEKYEDQQKVYYNYKTSLEQDIEGFKNIIKILDLTKKDTIFHWALMQKKELDIAQESILFYLIDVVINKPNEIFANMRYTDNPEILFIDSYIEDISNDGVWFNLGKLTEFIPYRKDQRLFENITNLEIALVNKKEEIQEKLRRLENQLEELSKIKRGEKYDKELVCLYLFDESLFDYSKVLELKESEHLVLNKEKHFQSNARINKGYVEKIGTQYPFVEPHLAEEI